LGSARTSTEIHALCDDLIRMTAPQLLAAVQADLPTVGFFDELSFLRRHWNDVLWSVRVIKPISVGPDHCIAESVIMQPFAQTGPVGIPSACERRC